jgi:integrase
MLVKRGKIWYVRFTAPDGTRVFQTTRTADKRAAQEYEDALKTRLWREQQLGESQATWREAVISWLDATSHKDRAGVLQKLRWLDPHLSGLALSEITAQTLGRIQAAKLAEGVSAATVNRHMAVVSAVLNHARKRGMVRSVPSLERLKESKGRLRWLTREEAERLVSALRDQPSSGHIADMVQFALATGLRESNVTGLEWSQVHDGAVWISGQQMKSGRDHRVPLNESARAVLDRRRGGHPVWAFTYRGKRLRRANSDGFKKAVQAAGLGGIGFHTLRHTWASWHAMAGTPLPVLKELGGWSDYNMVLRYAHLAPGHLDSFAGNVD